MDLSDYALEILVRDRLAAARAEAAQRALARRRRRRPSLRARAGHALIALGHALARDGETIVAPGRAEPSRG
jgi:hypothetical protein